MPRPSTPGNRTNNDALAVTYQVADSLLELMEITTHNMWANHKNLERIWAQHAGHKLEEESKHNAKMQKKIAEVKRDNKESLTKGQTPAT